MKLLKTNRNEGYAEIRIENEDDLWHLKDFLREGDEVKTVTQRTTIEGNEKKTVSLRLEIEKMEYQENRLRVTGEITKGHEDVELGYHTFNLDEGTEFELWRDFSHEDWEKLEEIEDKKSYQVLFCLVEKGGADFFLVEESGIKDLSKVEQNIPGKMYEDQETGQDFHSEVKSVLERSGDNVENIVLGGPGHQKNKVYELLDEDLKQKVFLQDTSVTGRTGLQEAVKRGALKQVVESSRIGDETEALEQFFEELEKEGKASYGLEKVEELADIGAVKKLLITQKQSRDHQDIIDKVEQQGGEVQMVHTDHEPGKRLENFGGVAALLRYKP